MGSQSFQLPQENDGQLIDLSESPLDEAEYAQEIALESAIADFKGESDAVLYIYRMDNAKDGRGGEFIETLNIGDYSHDQLMLKLRDEYYGGDFKLQIRADNKIRMTQRVKVMKSEPPKEESNQQQDLARLVEAAKGDNSQMINLMMQQNQQNMQMITQMMTAIANRPEPKQETFGAKEMVTLMASIKEIMGGDKEPVNQMDLFIKGMEMGKEVGENKDESVVQTALKTIAEPLTNLAAMGAQASAVQVPAASAHPGPPAIPTTSHAPNFDKEKEQQLVNELPNADTPVTTEETDPAMLRQMQLMQKLQPLLRPMANAAHQNADTETYANFLLDQVGEEDAKELLAQEMYDQLYVYIPDLKHYKEWFDECREIVLQLIENPAGTEEPPNDQGSDLNVSGQNESAVIPGETSPDTTQDQKNGEQSST